MKKECCVNEYCIGFLSSEERGGLEWNGSLTIPLNIEYTISNNDLGHQTKNIDQKQNKKVKMNRHCARPEKEAKEFIIFQIFQYFKKNK
jgi:hypothetical protein